MSGPNSADVRLLANKITELNQSVKHLVKVLAAINENMVAIGRTIKEEDTTDAKG